MNGVIQAWYSCIHFLRQGTALAGIILGITGIVVIIVFAMTKIKRLHVNSAILISSIGSCVLMIVVITSFNNLIESAALNNALNQAQSEIQLAKEEARALQLETQNLTLQKKIAVQDIQIADLHDRNKLLESAQLSLKSFSTILEVALIKADFKHTSVEKTRINEIKESTGFLGWNAKEYYDEALIITSHDIGIKYGFDLHAVRVLQKNEHTLVVSGIQPILIGVTKNDADNILKEIRRVDVQDGIRSYSIRNSKEDIKKASEYADMLEKQFQSKLYGGNLFTEDGDYRFMAGTARELAEKFITVILSPLFSTIEYTQEEQADSVSLIHYINTQIENNATEIKALEKKTEEAKQKLSANH